MDFGTSTTKVVVGDRTLKQAFAVPFCDAAGIEAYLLPSRLYRDGHLWTLRRGPNSIGDLKLALMAQPDDPMTRRSVLAFIALVIRSARAWLFDAYADAYQGTTLVWTLAVGLPAAQATEGELPRLYQQLGRGAWLLAGAEGEVTDAACDAALRQAQSEPGEGEEIDVVAMPEIAAQVYGFVTSSQFDAKARNLYLLADVGAGTVDSCLFQVRRAGSAWSFDIFTAAVEANGVMNAHRARVDWWQHHLQRSTSGLVLAQQFEEIRLEIDHPAYPPASFRDYVSGVEIELSGKQQGPDVHFIDGRVAVQLRGRTLHRAYSKRLLNPQDIGGVPLFYCGGGARHPLFAAVPSKLEKGFDGFSWLAPKRRELTLPTDLRVPGVVRADYDRLSVAYGLSMLDSAAVTRVKTTVPRLAPDELGGWRDHYVGKDSV
ncbi:MAG: hypothetical protein KIT60_05405 [Burkholderiaceae bacterium]|nr:hypothetical protein [Burkholderiaceae bacterium]